MKIKEEDRTCMHKVELFVCVLTMKQLKIFEDIAIHTSKTITKHSVAYTECVRVHSIECMHDLCSSHIITMCQYLLKSKAIICANHVWVSIITLSVLVQHWTNSCSNHPIPQHCSHGSYVIVPIIKYCDTLKLSAYSQKLQDWVLSAMQNSIPQIHTHTYTVCTLTYTHRHTQRVRVLIYKYKQGLHIKTHTQKQASLRSNQKSKMLVVAQNMRNILYDV